MTGNTDINTGMTADAPQKSAAAAGLYYITAGMHGFSRKGCGRGFAYYDTDKQLITCKKIKERIQQLAIPPAYNDVWICPDANGHLQATGINEAGKKQYIYHTRWREVRDETKYGQMLHFGEQLPGIRRTLQQHLNLSGLPQQKVLAAVVRLLDTTHIRIGNPTYAQKNSSYGLTTLRKKHVDIDDEQVTFEFTGKAGKDWEVVVEDPQLIEVIQACESIPGYNLFKYIDEEGQKQQVSSDEVNQYLRELCQHEVTAKYFRTWAGTVHAVAVLDELPAPADQKDAAGNVTEMVRLVAGRLGNTPAVCRDCYIHPSVITYYLDDYAAFRRVKGSGKPFFSAKEARTLNLLKKFIEN